MLFTVDGRRHQAVLDEELLVGLKALDVGVGQHAVVVGPARELFGVGERDAVFLRADGDGLLPVGLDPLVGLTLDAHDGFERLGMLFGDCFEAVMTRLTSTRPLAVVTTRQPASSALMMPLAARSAASTRPLVTAVMAAGMSMERNSTSSADMPSFTRAAMRS